MMLGIVCSNAVRAKSLGVTPRTVPNSWWAAYACRQCTPFSVVSTLPRSSPVSTGVYWLQDYAAHQNFGTVRGVPANHFAETGFNVGYPGMMAAYQDLERQLV